MITEDLTKLYNNLTLQSIFFRRASRVSIAVFFSVLLYRYFSILQGLWIPLTIIIVMQGTTAATFRKGLQRFLGTLIGAILGSLIYIYVKNPIYLDIILVLSFFIAYYMKASIIVNYAIFVIPITIMVVVLVSNFLPNEAYALIPARLYDSAIGVIISIIFTLYLFPNKIEKNVMTGITDFLNIQFDYLSIILSKFFPEEEPNNAYDINNISEELEICLYKNRRHFDDWRYELLFKPDKKRIHEYFLRQAEKLSQFLFSMHYISERNVEKNMPDDMQNTLLKIYKSLHTIVNGNETFNSVSQFQDEISNIKNILNTTMDTTAFHTTMYKDLEGYVECLDEINKVLNKEKGYKL